MELRKRIKEIEDKCRDDFWYYPIKTFKWIFVYGGLWFAAASEFNFFWRY